MKCFLKVKMFLIKVSYPIKSQQQKMKQLGGELVKIFKSLEAVGRSS